MRRMGILLLGAILAWAVPVWAGHGIGTGEPGAKKSGGTAAAARGKTAKSATPAKPGRVAILTELERLQALVQQQSEELKNQQEQIEALEQRMGMSGSVPAVHPGKASTPSAGTVAAVEAARPAREASGAATPASAESLPAHSGGAGAGSAAPVAVSAAAAQIPAKKPEAIELAGGKIRLGFTMYGDWGMYFKSGFGPQFLTQTNQPGPGNDNFNSFDINRTYVNFFYSPNDAITMRITPNIYRDLGNVPAAKFGKSGAVGSTANGSLTMRVKYAYVEFNKLFAGTKHFRQDKLTLGQQVNPLVDWEESLYGYRFTSLVPWNYLSLSSTHAGVSLHGPILFHGKQYLDYGVGVFDSGSFHNQELAAEKQVMGRLSYYPMGAASRFDGLGFTGFVDFGYANSTPDLPNHSLYRVATLVHYTKRHFGVAGEYDYGKDAFGVGNLFSGSGPADAFGLGVTPYAGLASEANSILGLGAQQRGFDFFGHVDIPHSPFSLFGLYESFQPNINVSKDPLDFSRIVAGVAYKYDEHLRFALDSQNLLFTHGQFTFNGIPNAVPSNSNALFINAEFNY